MRITLGDLTDPQIVALLQTHLTRAHAETPPSSVHALDVSGLQAPDITFWAAWDAETLLGVGALKRLTTDHGEIKSMHTAEAQRGRGAATTMLRHIIDTARRSGLTRLSLETGSTAYFQPALALYKKHGFTECAPFGDYVPDSHSVFMTLELT